MPNSNRIFTPKYPFNTTKSPQTHLDQLANLSYNGDVGVRDSLFRFQRHEWEKHGVCAGVRDADDFFKQVCQLSSAPLQAVRVSDLLGVCGKLGKVMTGARAANLDLVDMAEQLQRSGYCVYHIAPCLQMNRWTYCL